MGCLCMYVSVLGYVSVSVVCLWCVCVCGVFVSASVCGGVCVFGVCIYVGFVCVLMLVCCTMLTLLTGTARELHISSGHLNKLCHSKLCGRIIKKKDNTLKELP